MNPRDRAADARALWTELAGAPVDFAAAPSIVVSPGSRWCPPGWVGVVELAGQVVITAPDAATAEAVGPHAATAGTDPDRWRAALEVGAVLGPAGLFYPGAGPFPRDGFTDVTAGASAEELARLEAVSGEDDAAEAGVSESTSPVFVVRDGGNVVAAAGYVPWLDRAAHIGVLVAPSHRGRNLAKGVGAAAAAHADAAGLLPQWRARIPASQRVALAVGFARMGTQLSLRLAG
ncbi:GNAT acetyltransferase-like protein [Stackebrandtia albiflava]|uniref:GNAT acetyltransferase-like protein n=1 Tax=Stackebrandtia albiflava TaxID=406432 RepID=A0A562VDI7_9ACTN|nr:GNAT family N-acetyltransferase [Stackebrandtia albiflava]TWJ15925.1 GNAT acetyltransferase-like protein [Stackebrandtia albiflava]